MAAVTAVVRRTGASVRALRADLQCARSRNALPGAAGAAIRRRPRSSCQSAARPRGARRRILPASRADAARAALCARRQWLVGQAVPANVRYVGHVYTRDTTRFNCSRARGAECQSRQHGALWLLAGDAGFRGRGRGVRALSPTRGKASNHFFEPGGRSWSPATGGGRRARRGPHRTSAPARSARRHSGACSRSIPTIIASTWWMLALERGLSVTAARSAADQATASHRDSRSVDHLVLG